MAGELVLITGATGFVGFRVLLDLLEAGYRARISVRRESSIKQIQEHHLVAPYAKSIDFALIKDFTAEGAFDAVLDGVTYIEHIASPFPRATDDVERDIVLPAINGTLSILNSALKHPSIRRVVITSSLAAILPFSSLSGGDETIYSANHRNSPVPSAPFNSNPGFAYFESKILALTASEKLMAEKNPHFSLVNIMPGLVLGRNELVTVAEDMLNGTNSVVLGLALGQQMFPRPCEIIDVRDVARVHVESLDEKKVLGNKSFILNADLVKFDDAIEIAKKEFPEAVKSGVLPLGGTLPAIYVKLDSEDSVKTFGKMHTYEEAVKEVIGQYVELKSKA